MDTTRPSLLCGQGRYCCSREDRTSALSNVSNHFNGLCCCCGCWHCAVPLFEVIATVFGSGGGWTFWREEGQGVNKDKSLDMPFAVHISKFVFPEASLASFCRYRECRIHLNEGIEGLLDGRRLITLSFGIWSHSIKQWLTLVSIFLIFVFGCDVWPGWCQFGMGSGATVVPTPPSLVLPPQAKGLEVLLKRLQTFSHSWAAVAGDSLVLLRF